MSDKKIRKLVYSALLAALVCVATLVIQIPAPVGGYVNLGDGLVLLCGWLLGPWYGALAAGVGSMLADLMIGFPLYAPATLVIKALMAVVAALLPRILPLPRLLRSVLSGVVAELVMIAGYFFYGAAIMGGFAASAAGVPGNAVQGVVGLVVGILLAEGLQKTPLWAKIK